MRQMPRSRPRSGTSVSGVLILAGIVGCWLATSAQAGDSWAGRWDATLDTPGGPLHFILTLEDVAGQPRARIVNGPESITVPQCTVQDGQLTLEMLHYDSRIEASYAADGDTWTGNWTKRRGADQIAKMSFSARREAERGPDQRHANFLGKWRVQFASEDSPAVGVFQHDQQAGLWGTFLTPFGDYRYLAGRVEGQQLELSCFDGSHAFLFRARCQPDGTLQGDFWSGDWWHDTWTGQRDDQAELPNAFGITQANHEAAIGDLKFADLDGELQPMIDESRRGKPLLIEIFGSWCPNCHDAGAYLSELQDEYAARGLGVLGLAFELTGDFPRDAQQVRTYIQQHKIRFPVLIGGISNKEEATRQLRVLDQVRAYPTILFVDRNGKVNAVYTGFNGPATGDAHLRMREQFALKIEQLLERGAGSGE